MFWQKKQGLVRKQVLSAAEISEIQRLAEVCERYEDLHMRLNLEMLRTRIGISAHDFLYYKEGELIGYIGLDNWGAEAKEIVGMVHPEHRRQGIFRSLLQTARQESQPLGIERFELTCEEKSPSGQACIAAVGAVHLVSEHEMVLANWDSRRQEAPGKHNAPLHMRRAGVDDLDALTMILAESFDHRVQDVRHTLVNRLQDNKRHFYIGSVLDETRQHEEFVGCLRIEDEKELAGIYGFGVRPYYQGHGYGRQMLEGAIRIVRSESEKTIMLDVETDNTRAFKLYQACGFEIKATYGYYNLALDTIRNGPETPLGRG